MKSFFIITPAFNAAATIAATIQSVISQVGRIPVHYHVQDGGSTDGTLDILQDTARYLEAYPEWYGHVRFSWASQPDQGMYHAVSLAVESLVIPSDALMAWINADDLLLPGCFERVGRVAEAFPEIRWMGGQPCNMDMDGNTLPVPSAYWHACNIVQQGLCDGEHFPCLQQEGMVWRKSLFDEAGGLDASLCLAGDWDLWRRMAAFDQFVLLPWPTGVFRRRIGQLSEDTAAYRHEINSVVPREVRRTALRNLWPNLKRLPAATMFETSDGRLRLENVRPAWSAKSGLRILFAARGWYWIAGLYQSILRAKRKLAS